MIQVCKDYREIPKGLQSRSAREKRATLMAEGAAHQADGAVYSHATVKEALSNLYRNKCAYCEKVIGEPADRRVDHYRPRNGRSLDEVHQGYYWLSYEWSNLLLVCASCNGRKSNKFPVAGQRVTQPPDHEQDWLPASPVMSGESPLLLNPEVDDPTLHVEFLPDGTIASRQNNPRGVKTIEICRLDRFELNLQRKKLMDEFGKDIREQLFYLLFNYKKGMYDTLEAFHGAMDLAFGNIVRKIKTAMQPDQPFSRVGWHINQDPNRFLLHTMDQAHQAIVIKAFKRLRLI